MLKLCSRLIPPLLAGILIQIEEIQPSKREYGDGLRDSKSRYHSNADFIHYAFEDKKDDFDGDESLGEQALYRYVSSADEGLTFANFNWSNFSSPAFPEISGVVPEWRFPRDISAEKHQYDSQDGALLKDRTYYKMLEEQAKLDSQKVCISNLFELYTCIMCSNITMVKHRYITCYRLLPTRVQEAVVKCIGIVFSINMERGYDDKDIFALACDKIKNIQEVVKCTADILLDLPQEQFANEENYFADYSIMVWSCPGIFPLGIDPGPSSIACCVDPHCMYTINSEFCCNNT